MDVKYCNPKRNDSIHHHYMGVRGSPRLHNAVKHINSLEKKRFSRLKVCSRLLSVQKLREEKRYQRQLYTIVLHHFKQRRQVYTGTDWSQLHVLQSADYAKNTRSTATYKNSSNGIVRHDHWRYKLRGSEVQRECV